MIKSDFHTHTNYCDGKNTPEEIKAAYKAKGYSAVAFTEHEHIIDVTHLTDDEFIAITAYEYDFNTCKSSPSSYAGHDAPPTFNFKEGKREWKGHRLCLSERSVIIVEGLHALNPVLLPDTLPKEMVFRLYVSPLLPLNLDDHNRIPTSYLRLLRRCVRDYETRGASIPKTLSMWDSVRAGEKKWIFPFQEHADVIFNSSTLYELAVLKKHIFPLLSAIEPHEDCYEQVRAMVKVLNYIHEADVDDEIPPTSIIREFIGGNAFYK